MNSLKGKTYEEIYGNKAKEKKLLRRANIENFKVRFMEVWKKDGPFAKEETRFLNKKYKGIYSGTTIGKYFSSMEKFGEEMGIEFKEIDKMRNVRIPKNIILNNLKNLFIKYSKIKKSQIKDNKYRKELGFHYDVIRKKFGSLDAAAQKIGCSFLTKREIKAEFIKKNINKGVFRNRGSVGRNEEKIIKMIERKLNIKLERQKFVDGYFVDGYDSINNIVYEIDEEYHKWRKKEDCRRELYIVEKLKCCLIRINEKDFLNSWRCSKLRC